MNQKHVMALAIAAGAYWYYQNNMTDTWSTEDYAVIGAAAVGLWWNLK